MTIPIEIEYRNEAGEIDYVTVDFTGTVISENNGIGSYEYAGIPGFDKGQDYLVCEEITWDKEEYTDAQNKVINEYLLQNFEHVGQQICEAYAAEED